jgi:dTDP-4-dehydrorhamnose reductase
VRVAVIGVIGRLGSALVEALESAPFTGTRGPITWDQPEIELDTLTEASAGALLDREGPEVVIHTAAWTDVDGCARDPELAMRRNGTAVGELAAACARRGIDLAIISTNEVFDGRRTDGVGYAPGDERNPINPYGVRGPRCARPPGHRADVLAVRPPGQRLPGQDRGGRDPGPRGR